jgi:hypothetical protein
VSAGREIIVNIFASLDGVMQALMSTLDQVNNFRIARTRSTASDRAETF